MHLLYVLRRPGRPGTVALRGRGAQGKRDQQPTNRGNRDGPGTPSQYRLSVRFHDAAPSLVTSIRHVKSATASNTTPLIPT